MAGLLSTVHHRCLRVCARPAHGQQWMSPCEWCLWFAYLRFRKSYGSQNTCFLTFFPCLFWPRAARLKEFSHTKGHKCMPCIYHMLIGGTHVQASLPIRDREKTGARLLQRGSAYWRERASLVSTLGLPHIVSKCWWSRDAAKHGKKNTQFGSFTFTLARPSQKRGPKHFKPK